MSNYNSRTYKDKEGALKCLREGILMKVYYEASTGNMRAAKLFLEATKPSEEPSPKTIQNQQNNLVQINGIVISSEQLGELPKEKRDQLNEILNTLNCKI